VPLKRYKRTALEAAEKVVGFVIPSEARNLLVANDQEKADSSGKCGPRNDKFEGFSATCKVAIVSTGFALRLMPFSSVPIPKTA